MKTLEEIYEEAKRRYPVGCKVRSVVQPNLILSPTFKYEIMEVNGRYAGTNFYWYDCEEDTWGEIVEYPSGYTNSQSISNYLLY